VGGVEEARVCQRERVKSAKSATTVSWELESQGAKIGCRLPGTSPRIDAGAGTAPLAHPYPSASLISWADEEASHVYKFPCLSQVARSLDSNTSSTPK
jgi:hypothetical protein